MAWEIRTGDAMKLLRRMPDNSVHCVPTSPPYWGLRDYGVDGQLGLERTPEAYIAKMVEVFREVRRVLRQDGTLWLNIGDSYANDGKWGGETGGKQAYLDDNNRKRVGREKRNTGLKPKDLVGIPWMLAFALRADGWWLRQDIIWSKPNPMPESVTDRCTKAHEYLFLLTKSERYFYAGQHSRGRLPHEHREPREIAESNGTLRKGERTILRAVAQHDQEGITREALTVITGYKRSSRDTYIQRLRQGGYADERGDRIIATDKGIDALGSDHEPLPMGDELRQYWLGRLPLGERKVLEVVLQHWPEAVPRDAITEATGYQRSSRDTYLQRLSARRLVDAIGRGEVKAADMLFG